MPYLSILSAVVHNFKFRYGSTNFAFQCYDNVRYNLHKTNFTGLYFEILHTGHSRHPMRQYYLWSMLECLCKPRFTYTVIIHFKLKENLKETICFSKTNLDDFKLFVRLIFQRSIYQKIVRAVSTNIFKSMLNAQNTTLNTWFHNGDKITLSQDVVTGMVINFNLRTTLVLHFLVEALFCYWIRIGKNYMVLRKEFLLREWLNPNFIIRDTRFTTYYLHFH